MSPHCIRSRTWYGYLDFGNRSSLELLATEVDNGLRRSRAKLCALIDVETPLVVLNLILILTKTLQQPHITHKCNGQLQEAECTIVHTVRPRFTGPLGGKG